MSAALTLDATPVGRTATRVFSWDTVLEAGALLVILGAGAFLRFYRLESLPPGIDLDEARNGVEALHVLAGSHPLFFTTFDPREPAFIYSLTLAIRGLGHTALAMRVTGAAWGLLGVVLTYPLARQWFGRKVALLATAGMAGSLWTLAMSRWAERDVTLLPPLLLFLYFFWRGFERRSTASFALAGVFCSACAYAYVAARILPLLVLLLLACQWLLAREATAACWKGLLAGLATAVLTIAPLTIYFIHHPNVFFGRIGQISSLGKPLPGLAADSVWQTAANTLGMFFLRGDVNWRDDVAAQPVFEWWLAIPFCLGLLWVLKHAFRPAKDVRQSLGERATAADALRPCLWLLLWQAVLLIPAVLARPSPQYDRTIGAAPSTYVLLAIGLAAAATWLQGRGFRAAGWALGGALVAFLAIGTYRAYFQLYPTSDRPRHVFEYGQTTDANVLNREQPAPDHTVLFLGSQSGLAVRYLAPQYDAATWMEDFSQLLPIPATGGATYVFAEPSLPTNGDLPAVAQHYFPDAAITGTASFLNGDQAGRVFDVRASQIASFQGARRSLAANFGDKVRLDSISEGAMQLPVRAGETVRLGLTWSILTASRENFDAFIHVVDRSGKVVAQDDRQGLPVNGWQPGMRFLSLHELRLPPAAAPGALRVLAGLDRRTSGQPSTSLGEMGAQVEVLTLQVQR